jgi:hypothetical protein
LRFHVLEPMYLPLPLTRQRVQKQPASLKVGRHWLLWALLGWLV